MANQCPAPSATFNQDVYQSFISRAEERFAMIGLLGGLYGTGDPGQSHFQSLRALLTLCPRRAHHPFRPLRVHSHTVSLRHYRFVGCAILTYNIAAISSLLPSSCASSSWCFSHPQQYMSSLLSSRGGLTSLLASCYPHPNYGLIINLSTSRPPTRTQSAPAPTNSMVAALLPH